MAKKGLTRKQLLNEPDEFITLTGKLIQWSRQNSRQLIYGGCVAVGILIILMGYGFYTESRNEAAATLLSQGLSKYQAANKTPAENLTAVKPDFTQLVEKYGEAPAGRLGQLVLAHYCLTGGSLDEAIKHYLQAKDDFGTDPSLQNIILGGLACAYEQKGEVEAAIGIFEQIAQAKGTVMKDEALFHLGRLYERSGQSEKSVKAYGQINSEFPDSVFAPLAREKMAG